MAYEPLAHSYLDYVFDNLMDGPCTIVSKGGWKWEYILFDLEICLCDLAHFEEKAFLYIVNIL